MLKEGWDVKNVYVIASMRASVSAILTEQTLGRGLRLPFGRYTDIELLDTLEVLGHERYEDLLKKAGVLNQQFIDRRTRAVLRRNAQGQLVPTLETTIVQVPLGSAGVSGTDSPSESSLDLSASGQPSLAGQPVIKSIEEHTSQAQTALARLQVQSRRAPTFLVCIFHNSR